jgi:TRAP-type C4-dicarboxylate transport system permease small subunit
MSSENPTPVTELSAFQAKLSWTSRQLALVGGYIMIALALMTVVSILGRALFTTPVSGDYEMVEIGLAIAVFFFLPECHRQKGHVVVDFFTISASQKTLRILSAISELLFLIVSLLFAWRLAIGTYEAWEYSEQTMILELPYWIAYLCGVIAMTLVALNSFTYFRSDLSRLRK